MEAFRALVLVALLVGCSFTRPTSDECTDNAECRAAFGIGFVCAADGLCDPITPHPRCENTFPSNLYTSETFRDAFVIGSIVDQTVATHQARENAAQLAFSEIADLGGLDGRPVGIVLCTNEVDTRLDELGQDAASAAIATFLTRDLGVTAILGPPSSNATEAVFNEPAASSMLIISPSATGSALTSLEGPATDEMPGRLWRTAPPDALQGRVIADDLTMRGVMNVAVIAEQGTYGTGLADELDARFSGTVERIVFTSALERNTAAMTAGSGTAEEVLFASSQTSDVSAFALFASSFSGYDTKNVFLTDSAANMDFLTDAAAASSLFPRIRGTRPAAPEGTVFDVFAAAYLAANGQAVGQFSFTAHSYDAAWLLLYGASWALVQEGGVLNRTTIARGMRQISSGPPLPLLTTSYPMVLDRFRLGETIDLEGASGELAFDPVTEETTGPIEVWTIGGGATFDRVYVVTP